MIINRLSRILGEKRISLLELSRLTGVGYSNLHKIYHEKNKHISLETMDRICTILNISVGELFEFIENK